MNEIFGLQIKTYDLIINMIKNFTEIDKVFIFGSRAMGNYKKGSDIDLAIFSKNASLATSLNLSAALNEELQVPYKFDVISFNNITNKALKEHIIKEGKLFYQKEKTTNLH